MLQGIPLDEWQYCVPLTGARVTLANAKALIYYFCAKLPSDKCVAGRLVMTFMSAVEAATITTHRLCTQPAKLCKQLLVGKGWQSRLHLSSSWCAGTQSCGRVLR